jgi:hypothetical protein
LPGTLAWPGAALRGYVLTASANVIGLVAGIVDWSILRIWSGADAVLSCLVIALLISSHVHDAWWAHELSRDKIVTLKWFASSALLALVATHAFDITARVFGW